MNKSDSILSQPIKIGNLTATNRFVINAMECGDSNEKGEFTPSVVNRYKKLFEGNAGIVFFESVTLQLESKARKNQLLLNPYDPENIENWRAFVKDLKEVNPNVLLIVQINHGGEKSSDVFSRKFCPKPVFGIGGEMVSEEYIDKMIDSFVDASKVLYDIGVDGVDLKYGHGYMICNILRPYNDRDWKYGGSWENRSRVPFEITERVRKEIPDKNFLVGSKITMWERFPGGFGTAGPDTPVLDLTEPLDLIKGLEERGSDFFMESCVPSIPGRNYPEFVYDHFTMSKIMKEAVKPETVIIGGTYSILNNGNNSLGYLPPEQKSLFYWANKNIQDNYADMIAIGRQSLADALLPQKFLTGREEEINWCIGCNICEKLLHSQNKVGCVTYYKEYMDIYKQSQKK
ncbi:MAG: 2,4-dienoyl-CoA reductase [Clostridiaceae bacterium]|nr:2,4-dienoyl-CoA reductase [Clostridiaceae bacterium]